VPEKSEGSDFGGAPVKRDEKKRISRRDLLQKGGRVLAIIKKDTRKEERNVLRRQLTDNARRGGVGSVHKRARGLCSANRRGAGARGTYIGRGGKEQLILPSTGNQETERGKWCR